MTRGTTARGLYIAMFMVACTGGPSPTSEQTFEIADGQDVFAGTGSRTLLGKAELAAYDADRKYVRNLMKRNVAMAINHADPRQHRFAVARMKLAGKTRASSPELFEQMDRLQLTHAARGLTPGQMLPMTVDDGTWQSQHMMLVTGKSATAGVVGSGSMASRTAALSYGYVDCSVYDGDGNALGDPSYQEVFGNMPYITPRCTGDSSFASTPTLEGDSFLTENLLSTNVMNQSYILGRVVSDDAGDPTLNLPTIEHPADLNADGFIKACLDRSDAGCEYPGVGTLTLRLPLKGTITISNGTFDLNKLGQYQRGTDTSSQIFVTLAPGTRGGCVLPQSGASFSMTNFWNSVQYTTTSISWDLFSNNNWALFSSGCRLVQDAVNLTMDLHLPFIAPGYTGFLDVEVSSVGTSAVAPNYHIAHPIQITNSCLAAGTQITTGTGAAQKIEDFHVGDAVSNPFASRLTVADMSIGTERSPMVHIVDSRGHELVMTEKHPLFVVNRGMVPAVQLKVGDPIKTVDGPAQLVTITRESYAGKVYNLKLGNAQEALALAADQTVMYANGILVGDSQIQTAHEFSDLRAQVRREALPGRWRKDYLSSMARSRTSQPAR
jgi:hypothetical protein